MPQSEHVEEHTTFVIFYTNNAMNTALHLQNRPTDLKRQMSRISVAETASVGSSEGMHEELRFCDACPFCQDACTNPQCEDCKSKRGNNMERKYTMCEVRRHCTEESCWLLVGNTIYDATSYLKSHPGGSMSILRKAGGAQDCSEDLRFHSKAGRQAWKRLKVGELCSCKNSPLKETKCFNFFGLTL